MATPILVRNAATQDYSAVVPVSGEIVITLQSAGYDPFMFGMHVIQCNAIYTVEVRGPSGVYAPYPKVDTTCTVGGAANEIFLCSGKWEGIKIKAAAASVVYWRADLAFESFRH